MLLALATGSCVTTRPAGFACPAHGGPTWRDVASDHFVLRTDLSPAGAQRLLLQLEQVRAAVVTALFEAPPEGGSNVEVVAFASPAEFRAFAPPGVDAYYLRSAGGPPRIVLGGALSPLQLAMLAHELTHHFLAGAFLRLPRWFAEGMATQMETVIIRLDERRVVVGAPPAARLARLQREDGNHLVPAAELFRWEGGGERALDCYATSWLLVHYLAYKQPAAFAALQRRLARGEAPEAAFGAALPDWDPARPESLRSLDRRLRDYAEESLAYGSREAVVDWSGESASRPIPSAEVHAIRLSLWVQGPARPLEALRAEVLETLAESPDHPLALQQQAALDGLPPLPLARRAVAAHPDDPRAWTFLASALVGTPAADERAAASRRAAELAPGNAAALHNLAVELLSQGRSGEALPVARQAAAIAPWSPPVLDGYAAVLADLGRCADAIPVQRRALDVLPERTGDAARRALAERLGEYLARCRVAPHLPETPPVTP